MSNMHRLFVYRNHNTAREQFLYASRLEGVIYVDEPRQQMRMAGGDQYTFRAVSDDREALALAGLRFDKVTFDPLMTHQLIDRVRSIVHLPA